jgi:hypothetical protein
MLDLLHPCLQSPFTIILMAQAETAISCILIDYLLFSQTNGGITNLSRMIEYREAFVKSLRSYARPVSAYSKYGGRQGVGF